MKPACPASSGMRAARCATSTRPATFLVIVATDRLSAFDYILPTPIPDKGRVLTALTIFWLDLLRDIVPNHFVSANVNDYPARVPRLSRSTGRPLHAGAARQDDRRRMRGARLHFGLRLEGLPAARAGSAASRCPPGCARATSCPSRSSRPPPRRNPGHDENIRSRRVARADRRGSGRAACAI